VPKTGPKSEADMSVRFVREEDLTDEQRTALANLEQGIVVIREKVRPVANANYLKPSECVRAIRELVPFEFNMYNFTEAWKKLDVRPRAGSKHPERTDEKYCVYDKPHDDYVYTEAFVKVTVQVCVGVA
jgi:hypothetical protein